MTAHNIEVHAVDSLLQNTLLLHRQHNTNTSGMTKPAGSSSERTKGIGLGLISAVEVVESGENTTANSQSNNVTGTIMTRSLSASSSNEPASPRFPVSAPFSVSSTPSSPIKSSFSSPQLPRLPSASTFTGFHEQPVRQDQDRSTPSADHETPSLREDSLPALSVDTSVHSLASTKGANGTPYTRPPTKSLTHQSPQPHIRRNKTSLSALAGIDHSGRFVHPLLGGVDPKDDTSVISVNIRFVSRDLWVKVDIPRNLSVLKARDLVLEKCQLTLTPPSAPSSLADASAGEDDPASTTTPTKEEPSEATKDVLAPKHTPGHSEDQGSSKGSSSRSKTAKGATKSSSHSDIQTPRSDQSTSKSSKHKNGDHSEKEGRRSHVSLSEEELQMKAAALVARLDMFAHSINGFGDEAAKINYVKAIVSLPPPKDKDRDKDKDKDQDGTNNHQGGSKGLQLKRLLSNTSGQHDDVHSTSPPDRNREGGASRLGQIQGWGPWRDRKPTERDILDHIDLHMDCSKQGQGALSESAKKEFEAWKASFGLFWVAAGHWLDDSRTINSYSLQPQDVLELQLRNHYIQLPPPGSHLTYYDHYAEGTLFKLSKKSRPVSILASGKESGVWKERWVVLQGSRLLIYHKRKDTTKKIIELPTPLRVMSGPLTTHSRMSTMVITLDVSPDPLVPKVYFRGTSEHDAHHWIRIFNSLNSSTVPLSSPTLTQGGFGSPSLGSLDENVSSISSTLAGYPPERKRNHTTINAFSSFATTVPVPSINPVLISNAAAAFHNLNNLNNNNSGSNNNPSTTLDSQFRSKNHATNFGGSTLENRDLNLLQHHPLTSTTKEDIRRRAITEPNRLRLVNAQQQQQQQRGHVKHGSKVLAPESDTRTTDVPSVPELKTNMDSAPGRKIRPVLGTEYLDSASHVLLATSSARSSMAPLYSGYIWIYVPSVGILNEDEKPISKPEEEQPRVMESVDGTNGVPVVSSPPSISSSRKSSVDNSKVTGRYVKCFAAISDQGHFQWVEVKKQNELDTEQELKAKTKGHSTRSSYSIQLRPPKGSGHGMDEEKPSQHVQPLEENEAESPAEPSNTSSELVQVSVAHKLKLFFFCIKISPSALKEVLLNTVEPTSRMSLNAAIAASAAAKAANKARHRLSSSMSTLAASALPPLPNAKSQSLTGSISKGKNMNWQAIAAANDNDAQQQSHHGNQALHPDRAMSATPGSVRSVQQKTSSASLKTNLSNISTAPSGSTSKEDEHTQFASPTSVEPASPVSPASSSSNVLSLAHSLQKAVMLNRQYSVPNDGKIHGAGVGGDNSMTAPSQSPPSSSGRPKLTLSEAMAAKQSAFPDSAAMLEQSKQMHEQMELHHRLQRAEERSRAKQQQQQQKRELQMQQEQQQQQPQSPPQPLDSSRVLVDASSSQSVNAACPFLELSEIDGSGEAYVILKGYTETEEGWLALQTALERFIDGPVREGNCALPPEDTLISSYHHHQTPEVQLSEKAQRYLSAKESLIEEANLAKSKAAVEAARCPTPDVLSGGAIPTANGPVAQIRATSVSLTRWINLSGGGDRDRDKSKKNSAPQRHSPSSSSASLQSTVAQGADQHRHYSDTTTPTLSSVGVFQPPANTDGSTGAYNSADAKRSGTSSLSAASHSSQFRSRPRLNHQRSADELLNTTCNEPIVDGRPHASSAVAAAYYSTATAMMHSKSAGGVGHGSGGSGSRLKPSFKGKPKMQVSDDESSHSGSRKSGHNKKVLSAASAVGSLSLSKGLVLDHSKPKSASPRMGHSSVFGGGFRSQGGARSLSLTAATNDRLVETTIMATMASQDASSDDGSTGSRSDPGQSMEVEDVPIAAAPEDRANRNSFYALYSRAHNMVLHGRDHNSDGDIGGSHHHGSGSGSGDGEMMSFAESEVPPHLLSPVEPGDVMDNHGKEAAMAGLHPLELSNSVSLLGPRHEPFPQRSMSGASSSLGHHHGSGSGNSPVSGGKKHQTVLGASKAAVSGVLGKFRKSVG